jgi:hypothetical protein
MCPFGKIVVHNVKTVGSESTYGVERYLELECRMSFSIKNNIEFHHHLAFISVFQRCKPLAGAFEYLTN